MKHFALALLLAVPVYAGPTPPASSLTQGDTAYKLRADPAQAQAALAAYEKAMAEDPTQAEACWKAARAAWWIADHEKVRSEKLKIFQTGIAHAQEAVRRNANSVEGHMWLSNNYGSYGEAKGIFKSLALVKPMRKELAEVIRINDQFDGGGGYRVLGILDYKVPGMVGGDKKRALEELQRSLMIDSGNAFTHYYLMDYYLTIGKKEEARRALENLRQAKVSSTVDAVDLADIQTKGEKRAEDLK